VATKWGGHYKKKNKKGGRNEPRCVIKIRDPKGLESMLLLLRVRERENSKKEKNTNKKLQKKEGCHGTFGMTNVKSQRLKFCVGHEREKESYLKPQMFRLQTRGVVLSR